ncbi:MAG TPA: Na+/H+ antiporter subunit E [Candidatus Aphodomonas merdavium]|mgnify:CR=1 FL=1|nr:Na+/H+ antiporter subunit E [Candidatus Aphodomonas merdavium]
MALFLFAFWLVLNGGARMDVVLTGIVITGAVLVFACKYLDWSLRREAVVYLAAPRALVYLGLLLEEIVKANIAVGKLLIAGKPKPVIRTFRTGVRTRLGRVLLANSITITPGTITLRCEEDQLTVHCLDESLAEGLVDSALEKKIIKMEETLHGKPV